MFTFGNDVGFAQNTAFFFKDDFERANSTTVGNGWNEIDGSATAEAGVYAGRMNFTYSDDLFQPTVSHTFGKQSKGIIQWNFTFAFDRTIGDEADYRVYLQLGDSGLMTPVPSTETNIRTGVGVNLGWMDNNEVADDEALVYWKNGDANTGQTEIAVLSGPLTAPTGPANVGGNTTISVTVDLDNFKYDVYMEGPGVMKCCNATGLAFDNNVAIDTVRISIDNLSFVNMAAEQNIIDNMIIATAPPVNQLSNSTVQIMQPDAGAQGMNLAVQFIGRNFRNTTEITTNSSAIVVGPVITTNEAGNKVDLGNVTTTMFFINATAGSQNVTVYMDGKAITPIFQIKTPTVNSGDFTGQGAGPHSLGNGIGRNGTRTLNGTIVLDSLIIPVGTTVTVDVSDLDTSAPGNQGYLPAIIVVDGPVIINGTLDVAGQDGQTSVADDGGNCGMGGSGGGGGGGGKGDGEGGTPPVDGGIGGAGFTGGGGGGVDAPDGANGGSGGAGTGAAGTPFSVDNGGDGGKAWGYNATGGGGGLGCNSGSAGGGGGTGYVFGSGGTGGTCAADGQGGRGGAGGGGDTGNNRREGAGGGFDDPGGDGTGAGTGGLVVGNAQLVPLGGGSGGSGGGGDDSASNNEGGGGGGGGGGALLLISKGNMTINPTGLINATGGKGGDDGGDEHNAGEGGGGAGGGIILQSRNVTVITTGLIDARGGVGGPGAGSPGGAGGDGRVRVDGLPPNDVTINGLPAAGWTGSEFVGPAIHQLNRTHVIGKSGASLWVNATILNNGVFTTFNAQAAADGDFEIPVTFQEGINYVTVIQNTTNTIFVMSSPAAAIYYKKSINDSVSVQDYITLVMQVSDDMGTADDLVYKAPVTMRLSDLSIVNDVISTSTVRTLQDSATVHDYITLVMQVRDDMGTTDDLVYKAPVTMRLSDSSIVNDVIRTASFRTLQDSALVDDILRARTTKPLKDSALVDDTLNPSVLPVLRDSATIDDSITTYVTIRITDSILVDDILRARTTKSLADSALVDDTLIPRIGKILSNSALVEDVLRARTTKPLKDSALVDDTLIPRVRKPLSDSALVDDVLRARTTKPLKDSALVDDVLRARTTKPLKDSALVDDVLRARTTKS